MTSDLGLFDLQSVESHLSLITILSIPPMPLVFLLLVGLPLYNSKTSLLSLLFSLGLPPLKLSCGFLFLSPSSLLFFSLLFQSLLLSEIFSLLPQALHLSRFSLKS
jgi:hypothetical protein